MGDPGCGKNTFLQAVDEPPEDSLTFRVQRAVESDVKRREIEKSRAVMEERQEQSHDQGRPPYGLRYNDAGARWVPDRETENGENSDFQQALDVIDHRQDGVS